MASTALRVASRCPYSSEPGGGAAPPASCLRPPPASPPAGTGAAPRRWRPRGEAAPLRSSVRGTCTEGVQGAAGEGRVPEGWLWEQEMGDQGSRCCRSLEGVRSGRGFAGQHRADTTGAQHSHHSHTLLGPPQSAGRSPPLASRSSGTFQARIL